MIRMDELFYWIVSGSLMIMMVGILRRLPRNKVGNKWINGLWFVVMLRLLCPILPARSFQIINWQEVTSFINEVITNESSESVLHKQVTLEDMSQLVTEEAQVTNSEIGNMKEFSLYHSLLMIWFAGSILMLAYFSYCYHQLKKCYQRQKVIESAAVLGCLESIKKELKINKPITLIEGTSPMIFGIWKPCIVLPRISNVEEIELILTHECLHYKRKDHVLNNLQFVILSLHWYNPLVWFMTKWIKEDREWACDEDVLARGKNRKAYAGLLVKIATQSKQDYYLAQGMKGRESTLEKRVKDLYGEKKGTKKSGILLSCIVIPALFLGLTNPFQSKAEEISLNDYFTMVKKAEKTVIDIQMPTLDSGKNGCIGPITLEKGDTWEVSLDWEGNGQMYAICQQDPTKLFNNCQSVMQMDAPIKKEKFSIQETGAYYFFVGNKRVMGLLEATNNNIKGTITISHQS